MGRGQATSTPNQVSARQAAAPTGPIVEAVKEMFRAFEGWRFDNYKDFEQNVEIVFGDSNFPKEGMPPSYGPRQALEWGRANGWVYTNDREGLFIHVA